MELPEGFLSESEAAAGFQRGATGTINSGDGTSKEDGE